MAKKKHLHILPTLVCLVCPLTFVITFIVAWQMGHVSLAFPYISDTGNYAPESCIFSQLLNITSMLCMDIVANFQVKYVWQIHYIGACLCFIGGTVYFIFQTFFSYYLSKKFDSGFVFYARSILCFLSVLMTIAAIVPGVVSGYYYTGDPNQETHWRPEDGGYILHIISTGSEWILALTQCILVLTFLPEFKNIHLFSPKLKIEGINDT
ncbi:DNA damage-regulated autophagy modulator protein 2-like isoform X5 [Rhodnius prolixus]|uniref:DNA damage-regulated autophagy modulator protein 2-like isoform X5 n=1 Tax=Rhodnius prolixus TaxID=13249 RepID=UPI003D18B02B